MTEHEGREKNLERLAEPAPSRPRRKHRILWASGVVLLAAVATFFIVDPLQIRPGERGARSTASTTPELWTCSMHPQVILDHPGQCPICGMDLVPVKDTGQDATKPVTAGTGEAAAPGAPTNASAPAGKTLWTCGMHPQVLQEEAGICPICHMELTPIHVGSEEPPASGEHATHQGPIVRIDPVMVQNMNVVVDSARVRDLHRSIRTVGYLDYDQEHMVSVTTKYSGFVEKVYVIYLGQPVRKGDPLFEVYSPELVQTQQELLSALEYVRKLQGAPEEPRQRAQALLEATRARLAFWDVAPDQVAELEKQGAIFRTLTVVAPAGGLVMQRMNGLEGMAIKPGMEVLHIADISTLWLNVEVYESQLSWVNVGSQARMQLTYYPGENYEAKVRFIEPQVSETTRTVRLTLEVPNRDHRLRAGMYATVTFAPVIAPSAVTVPSQSVIRTGERNIVVVDLGEGRFAPRDVELGVEGDGFVQVLKGLEANERVVTSAQFLIDSESNIRAAVQKMVAGHSH